MEKGSGKARTVSVSVHYCYLTCSIESLAWRESPESIWQLPEATEQNIQICWRTTVHSLYWPNYVKKDWALKQHPGRVRLLCELILRWSQTCSL